MILGYNKAVERRPTTILWLLWEIERELSNAGTVSICAWGCL